MSNKTDPQNNIETIPKKSRKIFWRKRYTVILALSIAIAISIFLFVNRETLGNIDTYKKYGYLGIFLMSLVCNATVFLPVGGILTVFWGTSLGLNPAIIGLVAACGASLGELSGYIAGFGSQSIINKNRIYKLIEKWMMRHGFITMVICSFFAITFDIAGLVAGAIRYPIWKLILACLIGRSIFYIPTAYLVDWGFSEVIEKYIVWVFIVITVVLVLVGIFIWWHKRKTQKKDKTSV